MSNTTSVQPEQLNDVDINEIDGGLVPVPIYDEPIKPIHPPVFITLAIGEGGGDLPIMLS